MPQDAGTLPAGEDGRGKRCKQADSQEEQCEQDGAASRGCGDGDIAFVPEKRQACLFLSTSSTPEPMEIKIRNIKPLSQPYWTQMPPPPDYWKGDTHRLFLALPRPSLLKAAATRQGAYLPRVAPGPPGRALSARHSAQARDPFLFFVRSGQLQLRPRSLALWRCQSAGPSRGGTGGSTLRGTSC